MLFNIPQFIDKEDKIVGPLTAKQLGWIAAGSVILFVLWTTLEFGTFIVAAIPVAGIFGAFAFYRPNNQPLLSFVLSSVSFVFKPKMYIWKRIPEAAKPAKKVISRKEPGKGKKIVTQEKIEEISRLLESQK